ncbi:MAG: hypothetical protein WC879_11820 [Melioribacteraceae bacterium]
MPLFEAGTTFLDHRALNIQGEKPKYFIKGKSKVNLQTINKF